MESVENGVTVGIGVGEAVGKDDVVGAGVGVGGVEGVEEGVEVGIDVGVTAGKDDGIGVGAGVGVGVGVGVIEGVGVGEGIGVTMTVIVLEVAGLDVASPAQITLSCHVSGPELNPKSRANTPSVIVSVLEYAKPEGPIDHWRVTVPVFGIESVPTILMNPLTSSVVAFETKVKVGVGSWAATSVMGPFEVPTAKIKLIRNTVATTQTLTGLFSIPIFLSFRLYSGVTSRQSNENV
jgi:hypothetical protein